MVKKAYTNNKKTFLVSFFIILFTVSVLFMATTMIIKAESNKLKSVEIDVSERSLVDSEQYFITYKINRLISDLTFLRDTLSLNYPDNGDFSDLTALWLSYSNHRTVFDQIRFIDELGNEVVRVNYSDSGAYVTALEDLQNKSDRYYFTESISLDQNQVYMSPLDLNIENDAIELPIKPVIRLATPFFDSNGVKQGIVIVNYSANDILAQIASVATSSYGKIYFLNDDGYWLYNSGDPYTAWAFCYDEDSTVKFPNYFAKEWEIISGGGNGAIDNEDGYFCFTSIKVSDVSLSESKIKTVSCDVGNWYIVSYIPKSATSTVYPSSGIWDLTRQAFTEYYPFYIILFAFSLVLAGFVASSQEKSREVKFFSEFDAMTNAYNRRSGIDKLSSIYKNLSKFNCNTSICFLDVNGLKEVNDTLGHEAGDELIITVASVIRSNIRADDFLIRLGGDEFLIVFAGIDVDNAELVWNRIVAALDAINNSENRKYLISVSHGTESLSCAVVSPLDLVLHEADVKMYEEKRIIKSKIKIIR